jgi:(p)ppGpp synthase/HD superfamily hydrolase
VARRLRSGCLRPARDRARRGRAPGGRGALDTLEDCQAVTPALLEERFGRDVADAVVALTKPPRLGPDERARHEREARYFAALRRGPRVAQLVKILDRLNNLACIHKSGAAKRRAYLEETRAFHLPLAREVDLNLARRLESQLATLERAACQN